MITTPRCMIFFIYFVCPERLGQCQKIGRNKLERMTFCKFSALLVQNTTIVSYTELTLLNIMTVKVRKPQEFICFETFAIMLYRIWQNFCWLKFSPKAHTMYWDKNFTKFNFTNCASYLPGSCGWSSQVAMCNIYVCAHKCVKIFTVQKNSQKNFHQRHALAKLVKFSPGENFHVYSIYHIAGNFWGIQF